MRSVPFSASGRSFSIYEWRGSGPATLHVHHADDEAWHVLDGELTFRYTDRTETAGSGTTVFVPSGAAHTYSGSGCPLSDHPHAAAKRSDLRSSGRSDPSH